LVIKLARSDLPLPSQPRYFERGSILMDRMSMRQLLRLTSKVPSGLRIASLGGLIMLVGVASQVATPATANAAPATPASMATAAETTTPLPGCLLPPGVTWQSDGEVTIGPPYITIDSWIAYANGVTYTALTIDEWIQGTADPGFACYETTQ
jgi:hypothetical protein